MWLLVGLALLWSLMPVRAWGISTSAAAAVLMDADTGQVLYDLNGGRRMLIASTTKIMTALVALERASLTDVITVKQKHMTEGSSMYLKPGERVTVEELLYGLLLCSGNDAAEALADGCGGTASFVRRMNGLAGELGVDEHRAVLSKQVHEDNIRHVTAEDCGKGLFRDRDYTSVDAMVTDTPDIPLVVFSADCGIILLHDPVHGAVGAAHAGWRGAACGIAYKTVLRMQELFGTDPGNLRAAIGAAIGPCCFETDADVPQALEAALGAEAEPYITRRGPKWHVDLKGVNARWLEKAGVRHIDVSPDCTACHPELYWSHRRMGQARGAQIAMICL